MDFKLLEQILKGELDSSTCEYINPCPLLKLHIALENLRYNEQELENLHNFAMEMFER